MWMIGFVAAGLVVVVVAALLLGILWQARRILKLAVAADGLVREIDGQTRAVWALTRTNAVAGQILEGAVAIEGHAAALRETLTGAPADAA